MDAGGRRRAHDFRYVALRYFNVAGADPKGRLGQSTPNATHLIKRGVQTALGRHASMDIFGEDYPTRDGTCVRDYIQVTDLIDAHLAALAYLRGGGASIVCNCGYGHGATVKEVVDVVKRVSGVDFQVNIAGRRAGDPAAIVAKADRIREVLGWRPTARQSRRDRAPGARLGAAAAQSGTTEREATRQPARVLGPLLSAARNGLSELQKSGRGGRTDGRGAGRR